jgi:GTP cyclohydrolase I
MLPQENEDRIKDAVRTILSALGEDVNRPGIVDTPNRVARMYSDILDANFTEPPRIALFDVDDTSSIPYGTRNDIVLVNRVPFYAYCEHHLAVYFGEFALGYIPGSKVLGISKLVRLFRWCTKRISIQERITQQAVDLIMTHATAQGAACWVSAEHTCMTLRGVKSPGSKTVTTSYAGIFAEDTGLQERFLQLIR